MRSRLLVATLVAFATILALGGTALAATELVFPLNGTYTWADRFGVPRSSGRTHQGQDLMAANGTPVIAATSGNVSLRVGASAGNWISLEGTQSTTWYMHLSRFAVRGGYVKAGQVIGYVGCTGNAGAGNYHLHFEIHPRGGSAVDPRPYLLRARPIVTAPQIKSESVLTKNTWYTTSGLLAPRHTKGTKTVRLSTAVYRLGRWSAGPTITATNQDYLTISRWVTARFALTIPGHWRAQAVSAEDNEHARSVSPLVYFWVR
jgi:hypothetical protein